MRPTVVQTCSLIRRRWTLRGQLQGVGFRPFVYRVATELHVAGFVRNDSSSVTIEAEGAPEAVERLIARVKAEAPALARITDTVAQTLPATGESGFAISASRADEESRPVVTVDTAVCADCVRELMDASDFRYGYPLINCTNCGPRYSIIRAMPYDRVNTTMSRFGLCEKCHQQYLDPADRRFHAQPVACGACGPRVGLYEFGAATTGWDGAIASAAAMIQAGGIVAIKGIGGFHLACRADDEAVVAELRRRKHRDAKPFAVMCGDVGAAKRYARISAAGEAELTSPAAPIILAPRLGGGIAASVTMGNGRLGVMVPYTPMHHLLFAELRREPAIDALVMTSANLTDEPLVKGNDEAIERLRGIADAILLHERDIERSIDDSVLIDMGEGASPLPIRRARGYVPQVVGVEEGATEGEEAEERHGGEEGATERRICLQSKIKNQKSKISPGLCVGGELKNTVAVTRGDEVICSHHLGDLKHALAYGYFRKAIEDLRRLFEVKPEWIAHDLHPAYLSTQWAKELAEKWGVPLIGVQHHHAHAAAVLAEHGISERALAIVCDGVGYGLDSTAWGGELLLLEGGEMQRLDHLRQIPLAGGDASARDTRRCAAGVMFEMGEDAASLFEDEMERTVVAGMLKSGTSVVRSSAAGRLFDAAAAMLGVCLENSHEAQAAMALETLAGRVPTLATAKLPAVEGLDLLPFVMELKRRREAGEDVARLSAEFHEVFARAWATVALRVSGETGVKTIGLSGGVFCNEILTKRLTDLLSAGGLTVLRHEVVPPNDGGIAFGQAAVAMARLSAKGDEACA